MLLVAIEVVHVEPERGLGGNENHRRYSNDRAILCRPLNSPRQGLHDGTKIISLQSESDNVEI